MKKTLPLFLLLIVLIAGCNKNNQSFKLKTVTLNAFRKESFPGERVRIRILDAADSQKVLGVTAFYPSNLPLPATLAVTPAFKQKLYSDACYVQLWGDSTGLISSVKMNMAKYKIIFPLEMEVQDPNMDVTLAGSWD